MAPPAVAVALGEKLGERFEEGARREIQGGSINRAFEYRGSRTSVFVKVSAAPDALAMFAAEAAGLAALARAQAVRVPRVLMSGAGDEGAFLALEWIAFAPGSRMTDATLGEQLAWQHRCTHDRFGWERDNTIGSTPQRNTWSADWAAFYREHRLGAQLELAARNQAEPAVIEQGWRLCKSIDAFFSDYRPAPSLLHGDLWGGNWGADDDGMPVIFDPAVYYGDREADIAMTRLFGGFGPAFYAAYRSTWPLDAGASVRETLYNLYHVLNHYNLFGGGYLRQAATMIERLLAEVRA
jgi:protein-ribulosamine 3-kinase